MLEDAQLSTELRGDLLRSRSAGQDYSAAAKLLQLRAALSEPTRLSDLPKRLAHPGWKLAALITLGGGAALLARPEPTPPQPMAPESAALTMPADPEPASQPQANPVADAASRAPALSDERLTDSTPVPNSSRREIAQLLRIRALLDRDPAAAHRLAERSQREFPRGILSEERQALAIMALAKTGAQREARDTARSFFARYPQSPMRELIDAALQR
jgi:hypothetical protein